MPEFNSETIENILTEYLGGKFPVKINENDFGKDTPNHLRKLLITVKGKKAVGKDEVYLEAVAKFLPESKSCKDIKHSKNAMKKEINFYKTVLPRLQDFQMQNKLEIFTGCPEYIGSRLNQNDVEGDSESVLLLQDLWESSFVQLNHQEGFDTELTKLILEKIAEFHAVPMVMKQKKPMEFKRYVKDKCVDLEKPQKLSIENYINDVFWEKLYENDGCLPYIKKLKEGLKTHQPPFPNNSTEPFTTVIHNDLWVKNIFIQYHKEKPNNVSLIDFQEYTYGSPASDVLNLLLTSTKYSVLDQQFYEMLRCYHDNLIKNLKNYDLNLEPYSWDEFLREVKAAALPALLKAIFFTLEVLHGGRTLGSLSVEEKQRIWLAIQQIGVNDWL